jgi:acetyl esterase
MPASTPPDSPQGLHPAMRSWLERIAAQALAYPQSTPQGPGLSIADRRSHYRDSCALLDVDPVPAVAVDDLSLPLSGRTLAARRYQPAPALATAGPSPSTRTGKLLAWFHGGGWVIGDLDTHDRLCRHLADRLRLTVVSVDYRLAPEHRCPAACDDAAEAVAWLHSQVAQPQGLRLVTGGDSAGAHLAAWAAHAHPEAVDAMLLLYPVAHRAFDTESYRGRGGGPGLTADAMRWFWQQFTGDETPASDPRLDLRRLWHDFSPPPATVIAAWHDPLHDDAQHLADHLRARGGSVDWLQAFDMPHGFARYWAVEPAADAHLDRALAAFADRINAG